MITFSRHARRRMKLYRITENDVEKVVQHGKKYASEEKLIFVYHFPEKFKYPLKLVGVMTSKSLQVVTVYPWKNAAEEKK